MRKKTVPVFTEAEQVTRLWDVDDVTDLIAKHSFYYSNDWRRQEIDDLWVKDAQYARTASLGFNNGYYVGMDDIASFYVEETEKCRYEQLKKYSDKDPDVAYDNTNLGLGVSCYHTCTTPLVYIADDGKTARFMGFDLGHQTYGKPEGDADAYFVFGLVFADCVKEDGEWKIWHLILEHEHTVPVGVGYNTIPVRLQPGDDPIELESGTPTDPGRVHDPLFGWEYIFSDMPKPYRTYDEKYGYGPESFHGFTYDEREERY